VFVCLLIASCHVSVHVFARLLFSSGHAGFCHDMCCHETNSNQVMTGLATTDVVKVAVTPPHLRLDAWTLKKACSHMVRLAKKTAGHRDPIISYLFDLNVLFIIVMFLLVSVFLAVPLQHKTGSCITSPSSC
jgi:hypothetical protein